MYADYGKTCLVLFGSAEFAAHISRFLLGVANRPVCRHRYKAVGFLGVVDREMPSEHHSDGIWFVKVRRLQL
ncbi:MAG: hypothetical protein D8H97_38625 [Neisseria sp.]|nr:MAG: hypothetical protein D8H97_38625 [Neisseria sp.]